MTKICKDRFTIRELSADDEPLLNDFFDSLSGQTRALFNRRDYNRRGVLRAAARPDGARRYFLLLEGERMVGYVFFLDYDTGIPELGLALRDELHGMGIGGELTRFAIEMAKAEGCGGLYLTTHVANIRAQALYEKCGFKLIGPTKNASELAYLLRFSRG